MASVSFMTVTVVFASLLHTSASRSVPAIFVFGDSLADVGNNNHLSVPQLDRSDFPHNGIDFPGGVATGRFSNGYNGVDYIAKFLGFKMSPPAYLSVKNKYQLLEGANFASAGSGVFDTTGNGTINMKTQIEYFRNAINVFPVIPVITKAYLANSLFIIISANNDMFEYYYATGANNTISNDQFLSTLAEGFETHVKSLYNLGARKFWISGTGQTGCVPFLTSASPSGACVAALNQMSQKFNQIVEPRMYQLRQQLPGLRYSYSNPQNMLSAATANSLLYGFSNSASACCGGGMMNGQQQCTPNATLCGNRDEYVFWDWFHPTQAFYNLTSYMAFYGSGFAKPVNIKQLVETSFSEDTNINRLVESI